MEYAHRTWGRCIGAAVFIPAAVFWARGAFDAGMKVRAGAYCALVAAQGLMGWYMVKTGLEDRFQGPADVPRVSQYLGLMGWYMVKSGLEDRFQGPADVPRVSQYRLAAHLGLAFALYAGLLGGALRVLRPAPGGRQGAGMGDKWIPDDILAFSPTPRNFTENPTTVQFDHRVLGTTTVALASALWLAARKAPLSPMARRAVHAVGAMAWMQAGTNNILTLLHYDPTPLAASHQSGSLALLTLAIWLTHEIKLLNEHPQAGTNNILTLLHYDPTPLAASHQSGSLALLTLAIWLTHEIKLLNEHPQAGTNNILTLLHYDPTPLAASHQSGSLALLTLAIWLTHEIKLLKYIPK
ncbi:Cytochrome c oxidase assembly protein [Operophtera brumata]|uniref:Cytochrome c oxidase assembly protein n=1 Tax=Operophtera brumata TaxID=104452 RepID=A0A0L7KNU7_OPEBR|nr:Cytochrome c oxidase assembly protein [Operophtera brumata]